MNISRLIILMTCLIMICASAHANDLAINSKVYFGGINLPSECTNTGDMAKAPVYCEKELPEKSETGSIKASEIDPDQKVSLVSDSMNAYIQASSRL